jgi:hypothetical protein
MIDLTEEQIRAMEATKPPLELQNPHTGETFMLIKRHVYELMCGIVKPLNRNWDNPADDDLIRKQA